jgi:FtsH-binding integral membrane protein
MNNNSYDVFGGHAETHVDQNAITGILKSVYLWMTCALVISGLTAMVVANNASMIEALFSSRAPLIIIFIAQFGLIWFISARIGSISFLTATLLFLAYSILTGVTLSSIFLLFTAESLSSVLFITAGTFAAVSLYGFITRKDLSSWGSILIMALMGLLIASVVNIFLKSELMYWIVSYVGEIIFVGLTAYDTQKIKTMATAMHSADEDSRNKIALLGAITLYLDFINLFLYILRIFGRRK